MIQIEDDLGTIIRLVQPARRLVSLVPSLTELLYDLGLGDRVVGVTKFCIHPGRARRSAVRIGGTKKFDFDAIDKLHPDLIIANKEENYQDGIEKLAEQHAVYVSDIFTMDDVQRTMTHIGEMTGTASAAKAMSETMVSRFSQVQGLFKGSSVLYFIWQAPYMVAGSDTFIHHILAWLGLENVAFPLSRYPELLPEALAHYHPDYVLLSSEPYPFKEKHLEAMRKIFPQAEVLLVDGEMFSWYGSRLLHAPAYFQNLSIRRLPA